MNTLAVQGIFGILVYVCLFLVAIASLVISFRKNRIDRHFMVIGGAFLVAHFVGNITVFENPTSYLYFMFWLSMINVLSLPENRNNPIAKQLSIDKKISNPFIVSVAIVCFIFIFIFNIQPARANKKTLESLRAFSQDPVSGVVVAKEALNFSSPHIDDIRSDISRSVSQYLFDNWQKIDKNQANNLLILVINSLEKNLKLHPLDIRNHLTLAQVYQLGASINNNKDYVFSAEKVLDDALSKSPKRQNIIYSLAGIKIQLGKNDEAIKLMEQAINDNQKIGESYWRLAYFYNMLGKQDKAREIIKIANDRNIQFTEQEQKIIKQFILVDSIK